MKNIGILTSGGDAPGMNAAIHSIVMTANFHGIKCLGFERGYNGVLNKNTKVLSPHTVKHISHLGGTILKSARCKELLTLEGQKLAAKKLEQLNLDGLIVIGGDGSFRGAHEVSKHTKIPIIGVPGTIDNDLDGTDFTIGYFTAVQTAVEAIDKVRDTADAFERIFAVEVMGRHSGFIAIDVGIATEAEQIICPEMNIAGDMLIENITSHIHNHLTHFGNSSYIIVVAEHSCNGEGAVELAKSLSEQVGIDCTAVVLGHIQRGGMADASDRVLAIKLGAKSVEALLEGERGKMIGEVAGKLCLTPFKSNIAKIKQPDPYLLQLYQNKLLT